MSKKRVLCFFALLAILAINAVGIIFAFADNDPKNAVFDEIDLKSEYYVGETFVVPTCKAELSGKKYDTSFTICYPDGRVFTDYDNDHETESDFILSQSGIYYLKYSADIDGNRVYNTVSFTVKSKLYSVSGEKSQIWFGETSYPKIGGNGKITKSGLNVKLASGETFNYNKIIDLSEKNSLQNILSFSVLPQVDRELDVSGITVILTDAYDTKNTLEIKIKAIVDAKDEAWDIAYLSACAPKVGQVSTGYAPDTEIKVQVNTIYGRAVWFPFYGSDFNKKSSAIEHSMEILYDYSEKQVFGNKQLVVDLDDEFFFKNKLWSGFTTGEVFLSVVGNTYYKDSVHLLITSLFGENVGDNETLEQNTQPKIELDYAGIDPENPMTVLGYKFPIFNAVAIDGYDGVLPVTVKVFNGYYSSNKTELNIVDGYFKADLLGVVTLEYSAIKNNGEVFKKLVDIKVKETEALDVVFTEGYKTEGKAGDIIPIADYLIKGNIGEMLTNISVKLGEKFIDIEKGSFKAESAGKYTVSVSVKDLIGQKTEKSYTITVAENKNPVFFGDVIIPNLFIVGQTYVLPEFTAYDYSLNYEKEVATTVKVNGQKSSVFTPESAGNVVVEYTARTQNGSTVKTYERKAVNVKNDNGNLDFAKFFDVRGLSTEVDTSGVHFSADGTRDQAEVSFLNFLNTYDFSVEFIVNPDKSSFNCLEIYLSDVIDENKYVLISINILSNRVFVNGKDTAIMVNGEFLFDVSGKSAMKIVLDARTGNITIGTSNYVLEDFTDFVGSVLSMKFKLKGIGGASELCIRKIGNQVLKSSIKKDAIAPTVLYNGEYEIYKNLGDVLIVYKAVITDVLSSVAESYVSVKTPDGVFAKAKDGTVMNKVPCDRDYKIELNMYGGYRIDYFAKDGAGQKTSGTIAMEVVDKIPPVITFKDTAIKTVKIGDVVKIPSYTVTDNKDSELKTTIILMNSYDGMRKVLKQNEFIVDDYGPYFITVLCYDSAGNMASATLKIEVKG